MILPSLLVGEGGHRGTRWTEEGAFAKSLCKSEIIRRMLRGLICGRKANYYLEGQTKKVGM